MAERKMKVKLGGFIALAMAALTALVVLFGGTPRIFSSRTEYVVTYPEAPGIVNGTPVRKSGIRIERIVSRGHTSPPDFWYDQPQAEWVIVLAGSAAPSTILRTYSRASAVRR